MCWGLWSRDRLKGLEPGQGSGRCWGLAAWEGEREDGMRRRAESRMTPSSEALVPEMVLSSQHRDINAT